jgi:hypothetical protein
MKYAGFYILMTAMLCNGCSENTKVDSYSNECVESAKEVPGLMENMGGLWQHSCNQSAIAKVAWEKSGNPTYYARTNGCEFLGVVSDDLFDCLPNTWPKDIIAVELEMEMLLPTDSVIAITDALRNTGIEHVIISTRE